jgi:hypothetical protein
MKITFEVDDNFVEYLQEGGWSKKEVANITKRFIEEVLLEEVNDDGDLYFLTRVEDFICENL